MGLFSMRRVSTQAPQAPLALSRPSFGESYLREILRGAGAPATAANLFNLAQRTALDLGCQGGAYMGQAHDRAAFDRFVESFSQTPADWLNVPDEMAEWLWDWSGFCHEALVEHAGKWARMCAGSITTALQPWEDKIQAPSDNRELWETVFTRNFNR